MTPSELKVLRATTGLSQENFAVKVLGVTSRTVVRWEHGDSPIRELVGEAILRRVSRYLKAKKGGKQ